MTEPTSTVKPLAVRDFPVVPIYEPMAAAFTQTDLASLGANGGSLVVARYDMPINYEGLLHFALLANTNAGQSGPNPGLLAQMIACAGGTNGTPKGSPTTLSPQELASPLVSLSDQLGNNLPVLSGTGTPALVARNIYVPSTRRLIATINWNPKAVDAPSAVLLWGYMWGYRWPQGLLDNAQQLQLLLKNSATNW